VEAYEGNRWQRKSDSAPPYTGLRGKSVDAETIGASIWQQVSLNLSGKGAASAAPQATAKSIAVLVIAEKLKLRIRASP